MNNVFLLMAQYNKVVIPLDKIVEDFFPSLTVKNFKRKVALGEIDIPIIRLDTKLTKGGMLGVHVNDLAQLLDVRRAAAVKEADQMAGRI